MPLPSEYRYSTPVIGPSTPTEHATNSMSIEQTFDRLPFYPEYLSNTFAASGTIASTTWTQIGIFNGANVEDQFYMRKERDDTDLIARLSVTVTANLNGAVTQFRYRFTEVETGRVFNAQELAASVYTNPVNSYQTNVGYARLKLVPRGYYKVTLLGRVLPSGTASFHSNILQSVLMQETGHIATGTRKTP